MEMAVRTIKVGLEPLVIVFLTVTIGSLGLLLDDVKVSARVRVLLYSD